MSTRLGNLKKGVRCCEIFRGIILKYHAIYFYFLTPIVLTYFPVTNCAYIVVPVQEVAGSHFLARIQYMGYGFIGLLTQAAFRVIIYSKICVW